MDNEIISEEISSEFVEQLPDEQPVDVQTEPPPEVPAAEIEPETIIIYVSDSDSEVEEASETFETQLETEENFEISETTSDYLKEIYANTEIISEGVSYIFAIFLISSVAVMCNFILKIFFNNDR